jgi:chaperonin GroEL
MKMKCHSSTSEDQNSSVYNADLTTNDQISMTQTYTVVLQGPEARERLLAGVRAVATPVSSTMGPCGLTVLLKDSDNKTIATKDGVTVSKSVSPAHPAEKMGAELAQEAAKKTADVAGDGTSTCTVMIEAMLSQAERAIAANFSQARLRRELPVIFNRFAKNLLDIAKPCVGVEQLKRVALIAANGDEELADVSVKAVMNAGENGKIQLESTDHGVTNVTISDGILIRAEILSSHFANVSNKLACSAETAMVVISRGRLQSFSSILPVLQEAQKKKIAVLLLYADYDQAALQALVNNRTKANVDVFACRLIRPTYDEVTDIAAAVGAEPLDADTEAPAKPGMIKRFYADKTGCAIVLNDNTKITTQIKLLLEKLEESADSKDRATIETRIASLAAKHAVIKIVAPTQAEMIEKKHRVEDAVAACKAALTHGVVRGGGIALLDALKMTDMSDVDRQTREILIAAAEAPARAIVKNAGRSFDWFVVSRKNQEDAYDAHKDEIVHNPVWLIDSALAAFSAFSNAASVCRTFVALSSVIYTETK